MTVRELRDLLWKYPDSYEVLIPIYSSYGFARPIKEISYPDFYSKDDRNYRKPMLLDRHGRILENLESNSIILEPKKIK